MLVAALVAVSTLLTTPARDTTRPKIDSLPLTTTRSIEFETTEGTWLSLDVSPDGRTLAFELVGDIYVLPIGGGRETRRVSLNPETCSLRRSAVQVITTDQEIHRCPVLPAGWPWPACS